MNRPRSYDFVNFQSRSNLYNKIEIRNLGWQGRLVF
jgi:hypothetical protein